MPAEKRGSAARTVAERRPIDAALSAGHRVRGGYMNWLKGAPSHVMAELLGELEKDGWRLERKAETRNLIDAATRERTEEEGGYTYNAIPPEDYEGPVYVWAVLRLGDHAHIEVSVGRQVPVPADTARPTLHRSRSGGLIFPWERWIAFRDEVLDGRVEHRIAEVAHPSQASLAAHGFTAGLNLTSEEAEILKRALQALDSWRADEPTAEETERIENLNARLRPILLPSEEK